MSSDTKTEPNVKQAVPFFRVTNMETSARYYVDGLGFEMTKKWTSAVVLARGTAARSKSLAP